MQEWFPAPIFDNFFHIFSYENESGLLVYFWRKNLASLQKNQKMYPTYALSGSFELKLFLLKQLNT